MKKIILTLTATLLLTACGGGASDARPTGNYTLGQSVSVGFDIFSSYQLSFYDGDVYSLTMTQVTYGYSMILGTSVIETYGTYVNNGTEDGVGKFTLNKAAEVLIASYSKAGGFALSINTADSKQTYPCELPASGEGEKVYAQNKEEVLAAYGDGSVVYTENNVISFDDPNGGDPVVVDTASGDVSKVLNKSFKQIQIVSNLTNNTFDYYTVDFLKTFEDGSFELLETSLTYGYSMVLGTTATVTYGKGAYGKGEDGYTPYVTELATDVVLDSYSKAGGFNISINTAKSTQTYPVELPATGEGEKVYAQNKDEVIAKYGQSRTFYTHDADCAMELKNPNA